MKKIEHYTNDFKFMNAINLKPLNLAFAFTFIFLVSCSSPPSKDASCPVQPEVNAEKAAQLNVRLGLSYLQDDQLHRAKLKLNRAMKLAPKLSEVHYAMAFYFDRVGEIAAARQAYQRSIALNPKGGTEHNNYGLFLCKQKEYTASEKEFLLAIEDPNYLNVAQALENAGLCVLAIPDEAKAIEYLKRALSHDFKRPNVLIELACLYYKKYDLQTAEQYLKQYNKIAEPSTRSLWLSAKLAEECADSPK